MKPGIHKIYIATLFSITAVVFVYLALFGYSYYFTDIDEKFYHFQNDILKPSGSLGHGFGIVGTFMMLLGVFGYMARKRIKRFSRIGLLKHWLEFHIFLCVLGPVLVLYHTSFKFGGLVAISFWSMVAVVLSGVIGRVIYLQIPRTIEGRELSLKELIDQKASLNTKLKAETNLDESFIETLNQALNRDVRRKKGSFFKGIRTQRLFEKQLFSSLKSELRSKKIPKSARKKALRIIRSEIIMQRRIAWLETMQTYLRYWHVAHLPFALVMLLIMLVHVTVVVLFGYTWIF